jgi:hypothetical protein
MVEKLEKTVHTVTHIAATRKIQTVRRISLNNLQKYRNIIETICQIKSHCSADLVCKKWLSVNSDM